MQQSSNIIICSIGGIIYQYMISVYFETFTVKLKKWRVAGCTNDSTPKERNQHDLYNCLRAPCRYQHQRHGQALQARVIV